MGTIVHRNNALKDKMVASNVLMGLGNDNTDTVERRIRELEEGGGGGGSVVRVLPLLDEGVNIADISINGVVSKLYAPQGGGSGDVTDVTVNGTSVVDEHGIAEIDLTGKQDALTAGANIQIQNNVISATDTTYSDFTGATIQQDGSHGLVPEPSAGDENKFLKGDGTWADAGGGNVDDVLVDGISVVTNKIAEIDLTGKQDTLTAGTNIQIQSNIISATDTTYSDFVGATSQQAGIHGLVPAPLVTEKDKFLKGDGTWGILPKFSGIIPFETSDSITISTATEIGSIQIHTETANVFLVINGMVSGTISADGTTVTISVKLDGMQVLSFSQICNAGANTIPVSAGLEISTNGNHFISIECSATDGTFAI